MNRRPAGKLKPLKFTECISVRGREAIGAFQT